MDLLKIQLVPVLVSSLAYFGLGYLWYNLVFHNAWFKALGVDRPETEENLRKQGQLETHFFSFLFTLVSCTMLAVLIGWVEAQTIFEGFMVAFVGWAGFTAAVGTDEVIFEGKHIPLFMINSGYHFVGLIMAACIQIYLR